MELFIVIFSSELFIQYIHMPSRPFDTDTKVEHREGLPSSSQESQLPDDVCELGAWAIDPILFEDPEFRALYDAQYELQLRNNEINGRRNAVRDDVRTVINRVLGGVGSLPGDAFDFPVFNESSLHSRETMGKFLYDLLKMHPRVLEKYFDLILECGANLSSQPTQKKPKKSRWGVEIPSALSLK